MSPRSSQPVALSARRDTATPVGEPLAKDLLLLRGVRKRYSGIHVRGVDLRVPAPGTKHTLVGEDGPGKPTLLGVLSGSVPPDSGVMYSEGRELAIGSPSAAVIHRAAMRRRKRRWRQISLLRTASYWSPSASAQVGRRQTVYVLTARLLAHLGMDCDLRTVVATLASDQRQRVEIARDSRWPPLSERRRGPDRAAGALRSAIRS
jgi:ribose transport system ATP-binding protein